MNGDLKNEVTPVTKAVEVMMQAQVENRLVLLLEGISDFKIFNRFVSESRWEIEYLEGKDNVAKCIETLKLMDQSHYYSILDNDPLDHTKVTGNVTYTNYSDLEAEILANSKFFDEIVTSSSTLRPARVLDSLNAASWNEVIYRIVAPWTHLRLYSFSNGLAIPMKDFPEKIIDRSRADCVYSAASEIFAERAKFSISKEGANEVLESMDLGRLAKLHRGHHLTTAMAFIMAISLGAPKIGSRGVEEKIRTSIIFSDFQSLQCVQALAQWSHLHNKCIWRDGLCVCHPAGNRI